MANTYKSDVYLKGGRARPSGQDNGSTLVATVVIPAGKTLGIGDIFYFAKIGENVKIPKFELRLDALDSNASAALAGKLGITASDACLLATATVVQVNTTGKKNLARVDGEATAIDSFAVTPFPSQTTVQDLIFTVTAAAGTMVTAGDKKVTLEFDYQYDYPAQYVTGVSATNYPFAGAITTAPAEVDTYNGLAP